MFLSPLSSSAKYYQRECHKIVTDSEKGFKGSSGIYEKVEIQDFPGFSRKSQREGRGIKS